MNNSMFKNQLENSGGELWTPPEGRTEVRIIPLGGKLPNGDDYPFYLTGVHPNVGVSLQETALCPRITLNKPCPLCAFVRKLYNTGIASDIQLAKSMRAYIRVVANIVLVSDPTSVKIWGFGKKMAKKLVYFLDDPEFTNALDPDSGRNFIIIKEIVDGFPSYDNSRFSSKTSSLTRMLPDWHKKYIDLADHFKIPSYESLEEVLKNTRKSIVMLNDSDEESISPSSHVHESKELEPQSQGIKELNIKELKERLSSL